MLKTDLDKLHLEVKEQSITGRYVTNKHLDVFYKNLDIVKPTVIGTSVNQLPIHGITLGNGSIKLLMWSQMHGNESTTTKALLDFINVLDTKSSFAKQILERFSLFIIPILNPDGAEAYTRSNANAIDLNRDAKDRTQPESKVLRQVFNDFKPDFCFNLHDQRTIYGVNYTKKTATLAFLSPAQDENRTITSNRRLAMSVIASIYKSLNSDLPKQIARYDDAFNINCVGDMFQSLGVPTILFEAGHFAKDYERETTRLYVFKALINSILYIKEGVVESDFEAYFDIPENQKNFYDIIIKNVAVANKIKDVAIQYTEKLSANTIKFVPIIEAIGNLKTFNGHKVIDAEQTTIETSNSTALSVGNEIDFVILKNEKILLNP